VTNRIARWAWRACLTVALLVAASPVSAQDRCRFLCAPDFKVEPTFTIANLVDRHRIVRVPGGQVERVTRKGSFELILALGIPTTVPRLEFTVESILIQGGEPVELEFETNVILIAPEHTGGWVESHFDIVDKYSPGKRPANLDRYTHKLNVELDTALSLFRWLPPGHWLRGIEIEGSLDYVATGLARAGDRVGDDAYLDHESPWSFSFVLVVPIAPR